MTHRGPFQPLPFCDSVGVGPEQCEQVLPQQPVPALGLCTGRLLAIPHYCWKCWCRAVPDIVLQANGTRGRPRYSPGKKPMRPTNCPMPEMGERRLAKAGITQPSWQPTDHAQARAFRTVITHKPCPRAASTLGSRRGLGHVSKHMLVDACQNPASCPSRC